MMTKSQLNDPLNPIKINHFFFLIIIPLAARQRQFTRLLAAHPCSLVLSPMLRSAFHSLFQLHLLIY